MTNSSNLFFELHLIDLPLRGGDFTWTNGRAWSILDRFLISISWEVVYTKVRQSRLLKFTSNHYTILLEQGDTVRSRKYFKFKNVWLKNEGFIKKCGGPHIISMVLQVFLWLESS